MTCERAHDDAAYLLGALSAPERDAYERHLAECEECRRELTGLAGLPGLLGRLPAGSAERLIDTPAPGAGPPDSLLDRMLAVAGDRRRAQRRRDRWRVAAVALTAACVAAAVATGAPAVLRDGEPGDATPGATASAEPAMSAMEPVQGRGLVAAEVALTEVGNGTQVRMECRYPAPPGYQSGKPREYALVVTSRDGGTEDLVAWRVGPGETRSMTVTSRFPLREIARVEIRRADGSVVLRYEA